MRELTYNELEEVAGGNAAAIAVGIGIAGGALGAAMNGGTVGNIATGALMGGLIAFSAGIAATGALGSVAFGGLARVAQGANSIALTAAASDASEADEQ